MRQVLNPLGMTEDSMNGNEAIDEYIIQRDEEEDDESTYALWDALTSIQDYIKEFGASTLVYNMTNESYEPLAAEFNRDYDLMKMKVMSSSLQADALCKDSY